MHLRPDHAVTDLPTLHAFLKQHPLGLITTSIPSTNHPTLQSSHIPWILDNEAENPETHAQPQPQSQSLGTLRGHIARANPQTKAIIDAVQEQASKTNPANLENIVPGAFPTSEAESEPEPAPALAPELTGRASILPGEVLIVFTSPVDHYISPNFYTESKPKTGKVAPTWNYAAVQVYGRATVYHDVKDRSTEEFLRTQLGDLARLGEVGVMGFRESESESASASASESASASAPGTDQGSQDNRQEREDAAPGEAKTQTKATSTGVSTTTEPVTTAKEEMNQGSGASAGRDSVTASPTPWKIADAPREYIATLLKNIVGVSVEITRIEGRFKVSQERPVNDRGGVVEGLEGMGSVRARDMADFVRRGRVVN
ncbi:FMN-binding split barrel-like protein [Penicillium nucicola]|uniref:FMN-binding split barrel-like protein n=1 Tax=Penicillium nucicola TaxID=1850975 RepID=UPI0025451A7E|nr:FMN-binding split barrel-like protein [Penicillium nucicola]KAJ5747864.1 FMN-binding split barrel-like protein [Penicillium nucicola]